MKKIILLLIVFSFSNGLIAQQKINVYKKNDLVTVKKETIVELRETVIEQKHIINDLTETVSELQTEITKTHAYKSIEWSMSEAVPNPSKSKSELQYFVDSKADNAYITVYNMSQKKIREYPLNIGDKNYLLLNTSNFCSGMYIYVLTVNGMKMDSKKLYVE